MLLTVMSLNAQIGAQHDGRWDRLTRRIRTIGPGLLMLQEVDWLGDPVEAEAARAALGMDLYVAPSRMFNTAIAWNPDLLQLHETDSRYSTTDLHHGYALAQFTPLRTTTPWPVPLTALSTHLTPFSADAAGLEAQMIVNRAWRYGGIAVAAGDMNHQGLTDPEPNWSALQPHHRVSRCLRREHPDDPWRGNPVVGQTFRDGDMTDVAVHLANLHQDPGFRAPTIHGFMRLDQFHVTPALRPAIVGYELVDTDDDNDHSGILAALDLDRADLTAARTYI
ncbi:hypothetical protein AB0M32_17305 [Streptomyces sp. NPDC051985]|uniref:hypothetical protein n=1 Tax=Streptomyces sp. NPDC051985 TaxID=3155807 RepID=UPI0034315708